MSTLLTTPISETVDRFDILNFNADLTTGLFNVTVRLSDATGTIIRQRTLGGTISSLALAAGTGPDIITKLTAFLKTNLVVN